MGWEWTSHHNPSAGRGLPALPLRPSQKPTVYNAEKSTFWLVTVFWKSQRPINNMEKRMEAITVTVTEDNLISIANDPIHNEDSPTVI
jgi:hypothetical protein